jgi:hypothetical protein
MTQRFQYETVLKWTRNKKVNNGIGLIPAGIDFVHRKKLYTTMQALDVIKSDMLRFKNANYKCDNWYNMWDGSAFNKTMFMGLR